MSKETSKETPNTSPSTDFSQGIYDATSLGKPRVLVLGLQHMFAMFGATVLVPLITGLSVSTTLLCAGLGTLLFHLITGGKVPAFLGSSFAYLGGFAIVAPMLVDETGQQTIPNTEMLPYACAGVALSGLVYVVFSLLISVFGIRRIMKLFPPVVTGPIIIAIGLILAPSAITNCQTNWLLAFVALGTVIVCNIWGKGMIKILPILLGVLVSYVVALVTSAVDFSGVMQADWFGIPLNPKAMGLFAIDGSPEFISAVLTIVPIALATMMEHVGDVASISATVGKNFIRDPGLNRTLLGDGLATSMAGLLGGPSNTTYGENTGVLALTKIYDPRVIRIAAVFAMILSFSPKFDAIINSIPAGIIGGISFVLYGMISAIGVRNVVENQVDFTNSRNLIIAAVILVCALGFNSVGGLTFTVANVAINLSGLAIAAIAGILLNALLPGNTYEFDDSTGTGEGASLRV
ncbi:uracil-xanthine permease family protein [Gemmiger sp. An194]|uniref:uracil-xanthine permease family protein n=1 Tax=Gemmiger sp. An194 TaxID=1965582 RepID=UPI000B390262|nr:uracil-xanthine permease family protein [Gemmiger sp. An194]OUP22156.1 ABC transporter permease [Gemmiger sp. An194]